MEGSKGEGSEGEGSEGEGSNGRSSRRVRGSGGNEVKGGGVGMWGGE